MRLIQFGIFLQVQGSDEGPLLPARGLLWGLGVFAGADEDASIATAVTEQSAQTDVFEQPHQRRRCDVTKNVARQE